MRAFSFFTTWLFFSEIVILWLIGNRTEWSPIRSVIILVINKSDSRWAVVRFCYHSYDYRPNWTPLSPITITNRGRFLYEGFRWKECLKEDQLPVVAFAWLLSRQNTVFGFIVVPLDLVAVSQINSVLGPSKRILRSFLCTCCCYSFVLYFFFVRLSKQGKLSKVYDIIAKTKTDLSEVLRSPRDALELWMH